MKKCTTYPRKKTIAWLILNIIKASGPNGIRRKHIMQILFIVLGKQPYDTDLDRGWYSSYFNDPRTAVFYRPYGIVPLLCKKVNGKYWTLNASKKAIKECLYRI